VVTALGQLRITLVTVLGQPRITLVTALRQQLITEGTEETRRQYGEARL
jgi:hypothetical protein